MTTHNDSDAGLEPISPLAISLPGKHRVDSAEAGLSGNVQEIRDRWERVNEMARASLEEVLEIGAILNECKRRVGHGKWRIWCHQANLPFSERTAQHYMQLADHRDELKSAKVADSAGAMRLIRQMAREARSLVCKPGAEMNDGQQPSAEPRRTQPERHEVTTSAAAMPYLEVVGLAAQKAANVGGDEQPLSEPRRTQPEELAPTTPTPPVNSMESAASVVQAAVEKDKDAEPASKAQLAQQSPHVAPKLTPPMSSLEFAAHAIQAAALNIMAHGPIPTEIIEPLLELEAKIRDRLSSMRRAIDPTVLKNRASLDRAIATKKRIRRAR